MKRLFPKYCILVAFFTFLILISHNLAADTIALTDGTEMKGLVVDEYVDRVVVSTFDGEKTVLRKNIKSISYEDEETRLLKLGDDAMARGQYKNAVYYYETVSRLNPNSVAAHDGKIAAVRKQLNSGADKAKEEVDLMIALEGITAKTPENPAAAYERNVRDLLGLKLKKDEEKNTCCVETVMPNSVSADYGIRKNDIISAVWTDTVKYMRYENLMGKLAGPEFSMIKLTIEREVILPEPKKLKWGIGINEGGYFIKEISGLKDAEKKMVASGDWIVEVNSASTRYLPKGELNRLLFSDKAPLTLLLKSDLYITRGKRR